MALKAAAAAKTSKRKTVKFADVQRTGASSDSLPNCLVVHIHDRHLSTPLINAWPYQMAFRAYCSQQAAMGNLHQNLCQDLIVPWVLHQLKTSKHAQYAESGGWWRPA